MDAELLVSHIVHKRATEFCTVLDTLDMGSGQWHPGQKDNLDAP